MVVGLLGPMDMLVISEDNLGLTTIWQEIRNGTYIDKIMVAEVIRDRTKLKYQSDGTIAGTVLHPFAFSGWNPTDPNRIPSAKIKSNDPVVKECWDAWNAAMRDGTNYAKGAVLYHAVAMNPRPLWANDMSVIKVAQTNFHIFYKDMKVQK